MHGPPMPAPWLLGTDSADAGCTVSVVTTVRLCCAPARGVSHILALAMRAEKWMLAKLRVQMAITEGLPESEQLHRRNRSHCHPPPVLGNASSEVDAVWDVAGIGHLQTQAAIAMKLGTLWWPVA